MKRTLLLMSFWLAVTSCTTSKQLIHLSMPETALDSLDTLDLAEYERKYDRYDGVFLNVEDTIEHSGGKGAFTEWKFHRTRRLKYLVLNPDAQELTTFRVNSKPDVVYMRVRSPDGEIRDFGLRDLEEEKDSDGSTVYTFVYPNVVKGSLIDEGYELSYTVGLRPPPLDHDIPLQFSVPCEQVTVRYAYPDWWALQVKNIAPNTAVEYTILNDEDNHKKILTYEGTNISPFVEEQFSPLFKEVADYLQFMVVDLNMLESAKLERAKTWHEFTENLRKRFLKKSKDLQLDWEIVEGAHTGRDTLEAIVDYVRDNIEVTNKSKDGNYAKVLEKKEGGVYDITGLVQAMLQHFGLAARYLLVHSATDGYFDRDYVSSDQLYLPAVGVTADGEEYVILPYFEYLPVDHVPKHLQGEPALVIDEEESATFVMVSVGNRANNLHEEFYDLSIKEDGSVQVRERKVLRGLSAYVTRKLLTPLREDELEEVMEELLTYTDGEVYLSSHNIVNLEDYKEPLVLELDYSIENLVTVTPEEIVFQTGGLFSPISGKKLKEDPEERHNPVKVRFDQEYKKEILIQFPGEWTVATEMSGIEFHNQFGSIRGHYSIGNDRIQITQQVRLNRALEPKESIRDLLALIGNSSRLFIPTIIFRTGGPR